MAFPQEIMTVIESNPWVLVGLAAVGAGLYIVNSRLDERAIKSYEGKTLEQRVLPDLKFVVNTAGIPADKPLYIGNFNQIGNVYKYLEMELNDEGVMMANGEFDDDVNTEKVMVFLLAPQGKLKRALWEVSDIWFGKNKFTKMLVCYGDFIDDDVQDYFKISNEADFMPYAGLLVQKGNATINVAQDVSIKTALEIATNYFPDFAEELSERDVNHAQRMGETKQLQEGEARSMLDDIANQ